jgi:hypothetical protein
MNQLQKKRLLVSSAKQSLSESAVGAPIGAQDTNQSSEDWRSGYQDSENEISMHIAHISGYHNGIRRGARSI